MKQNRSSSNKGRRAAKASRSREAPRVLPAGYRELLDDLKARVRAAQIKAAVAANRELIQLYWDIGRSIVERQQQEGWGQGVIERLADDVQRAFPDLKGFSRSNVFRMRAFFLAYQKVPRAVGQLRREKVPQPVGQIPGYKVAQAVRQLGGTPLPDARRGNRGGTDENTREKDSNG